MASAHVNLMLLLERNNGTKCYKGAQTSTVLDIGWAHQKTSKTFHKPNITVQGENYYKHGTACNHVSNTKCPARSDRPSRHFQCFKIYDDINYGRLAIIIRTCWYKRHVTKCALFMSNFLKIGLRIADTTTTAVIPFKPLTRHRSEVTAEAKLGHNIYVLVWD